MSAGADQSETGIDLQISHRSLAEGRRLQTPGDARGQTLHGSVRDADGEVLESILDAFTRSRAARARPPALLPEILKICVADRPLLLKIVLVHQQHEWQGTAIRFDALAQRKRHLERRGSRPVGHQHVSRGAAQIAHAKRGNIVFARDVPEDEVYDQIGQVHGLLVDLDANRGEIGFGEDALDVAFDQAGLAYTEAAEHADLLLQCRGHCCSSIPTVNETRRFAERAATELPASSGSSGPAPPPPSQTRSEPPLFPSARTPPGPARPNEQLNVPPPPASGGPGP